MVLRYPLAILLAASTFLTTAPAHADPLDFAAASAQTTFDQVRATEAHARHLTATAAPTLSGGMPNVSCTKPALYGAEVLPHEDLVFAEVRQTDQVFASATCVSLTGEAFQMSVEVRVEYCAYRTSLTTCRMATGFTGSTGNRDAFAGVANASGMFSVVYPDLHAAIGRPRRVYGCVRTTLSGTGCLTWDYSATYGH